MPRDGATARHVLDRRLLGEAPVEPAWSAGELPASLGERRAYDPAWCLVSGDENTPWDFWEGAEESLFALGDGLIATRGVAEEHGGEKGVVLASGLYESATGVREALVPLPGWCRVRTGQRLPPGRRVLDLRDGLLIRTSGGPGRQMRTVRFACIERPGIAVMAAAGQLPPGDDDGDARPAPDARADLGGGARSGERTDVGPAGGTGAGRDLVRIAAYSASPHRVPSAGEVDRHLQRAAAAGAAGLLAEQRRAWSARWSASDVDILGDPEMTRAVRFALFHVQSSARPGGEAAVGARGLTGPAYAGHVFWDTDVFLTPLLAATSPASARAVLEYRIRRLPAARRPAAAEGRMGARFPWESARDGTDVTPTSGLDHLGETVNIRTGQLEEHITADVAWAAWALAAWTGSWRFLDGPGRPLVTDTARYWMSRIRTDEQGRGHVEGVIGPDEYHEDVDDNMFTNVLARWNLRRAADLVDRSPRGDEAAEAEAWRAAADRLVDGYDPRTGLYEQFAGYHELAPVLAEQVGPVPVAADLVLGYRRLAATQIIKQADVLMAHFMVPGELVPAQRDPNVEHYLARTAHGSSLSPAVHAAVLARHGRPEDALRLLQVAAAIDMEDLTETTAGGVHMANLGGIWSALVTGFAGVAVTGPGDGALAVDPVLPDGWEEMRIRLRWHGRRLVLTCRRDCVGVECDRPVRLVVRGTPVRVEPGGLRL